VFATAHENVFFRGELQDDRCKKKACHGDEKQTRSYHDHAIPPFLHLAGICWHKLRASRLPQPHVNGLRVHRVEDQEEDLGDQCDQTEVTFEGSKPNDHEKSQGSQQTENPKDGHACVCYLMDMSYHIGDGGLAAVCECFASDQRKEGIGTINDTYAENSDTSETMSHEFEYVRFHHHSFQNQSLRSTVSLWSNFYHMLKSYQW